MGEVAQPSRADIRTRATADPLAIRATHYNYEQQRSRAAAGGVRRAQALTFLVVSAGVRCGLIVSERRRRRRLSSAGDGAAAWLDGMPMLSLRRWLLFIFPGAWGEGCVGWVLQGVWRRSCVASKAAVWVVMMI